MKLQRTACLMAGLLLMTFSARAADPMTGVDATDNAQFVRDLCAKTPGCSSSGILPITLRTGNAATCINSVANDSTRLDDSANQRLYYMYRFRSSCSDPVTVNLKIGERWNEFVGTIDPGADVNVSVMYSDGASGPAPGVVMFCLHSGTPQDDQTCTSAN